MRVTDSEFVSSKILVLLLTLFITSAIAVRSPYSVRCDVGNLSGVQVLKSNDNVPGRYVLQHCLQQELYTKWKLGLYYLEDTNKAGCRSYDHRMVFNSKLHSKSELAHLNSTCNDTANVICFNYTLELIFNGCYWVSSQLEKANLSSYHSDTLHYIHNKLTMQSYLSNKAAAQVSNKNDQLSILWISGLIPITSFKLEICPANNTSSQECRCIEQECSQRQWWSVECGARGRGPARLLFRHSPDLAWTHGLLADLSVAHFNIPAEEAGAEPAAGGAVRLYAAAGAAAAAALLLLLLLLAALLLRARRPRRRDCSLEPLRVVGGSGAGSVVGAAVGSGVGAGVGSAPVLLVYASDAAAEGRLLAALLADNGAHVVDLQSARCAAECAADAAGWLRARLAAPASRVLLLQSPAMRRSEDAYDRVVNTFADTLVHQCVHHVYNATHLQYNRYFIATVAGWREQLAAALPFTRYELPAAAALLLRDLRCPPPARLHAYLAASRAAAADL